MNERMNKANKGWLNKGITQKENNFEILNEKTDWMKERMIE